MEESDSTCSDEESVDQEEVKEENSSESEPSTVSNSSENESIEKYKKDFLYLKAEFDNFRKRNAKERVDLIRYGSEAFVMDFLNVLDNFERAFSYEVTAENLENFKLGMKMISGEFSHLLERQNISVIPAINEAFDPTVHEAVGSEETNEVNPGYIYKVFAKGYKLHDKVIRPAKVIVAKEVSEPEDKEALKKEDSES